MTLRTMTPSVIKLDNTSGSLADISGQTVSCTLTARMSAGSYYVLNSRDEKGVSGKMPRGYDISLTIVKTSDSDQAYDIIEDWLTGTTTAEKTIELYDPDETVGSNKATGEVILVNPGQFLGKTANSGEAQTLTVQLRASGGLTFSTVAAT